MRVHRGSILRVETGVQSVYFARHFVALEIWVEWAREIAHDYELMECDRLNLLNHMLDWTPVGDCARPYIQQHAKIARQEYETMLTQADACLMARTRA